MLPAVVQDWRTGQILSEGDAALRSELGQRLDRLMAANGTAPKWWRWQHD
jgi:hypothetical protein